MKTRPLILLAGAVTLAAASALVARALLRPPPPVTVVKEVPAQAPTVPTLRVLTTSRPLEPGDFIDGNALAWTEQTVENTRVDQLSAAADAEQAKRKLERSVYGATLRRSMPAGEPITRDLLLRAGEPGFLAVVLTAGMRAVSVPTSAVSSNAGLVGAGDRVDVILSLNRQDMMPPNGQPNSVYSTLATQTIVRNVRVLALDSNSEGIAPSASDLPEDEATTGNTRRTARAPAVKLPPLYQSLTLEVTPAAAEKLALAREVGTLQVALRSTHEGVASELVQREATRLGDTTTIFDGAFKQPPTVTTFRGDKKATETAGGMQP